MKLLLVTLCLAAGAVAVIHAYSNPKSRAAGLKNGPPVFCPSLPLPAMEVSDFQSKMQSHFTALEQKIQAVLTADKNPGGAVVSFVYRDQAVWTKGFGLINMTDPSRGAPGANTGFRIGSITKVLTSLMTLILRDEKKLSSLDEDITKYLPEFKIKNPFKTNRGITFRQLMSHMSGLPRNTPCEDIFRTGCSLSDHDIYRNLEDIELMYPPGDQPAYSNLGFGLLGRVLEKITKSKWEDAVKDMLFTPLGMSNSGNSFPSEVVFNMAVGYYPDGSVADFIDIGWDGPAGQSYSSAEDLGKLMALLFSIEQTYNSKKGQILDGESLREWTEQPAYMYADGSGFGYPWELIPLGNYTLHTKDGALNGYNAEFQMATELKTGFIFLHSCDGCSSHNNITALAQLVLLQAADILSLAQPPPSVPPNNSMDYVGVYIADLGNLKDVVNVSYSMPFGHPALIVKEGGDTALLEWVEKDSFQISVRGFPVPCFVLGSGHIGERVYFQRSLFGKVVSLTLPGLSYGKVWKKQQVNQV